MDAYSPITIAAQLPPDTRKSLFCVLAGLSSQDFFGPEMDRFSAVLDHYDDVPSHLAEKVIEAHRKEQEAAAH